VTAQIGREPRGVWKVARRCGCGLPQVIETHPQLEDGTPFPTLWWLTCKKLTAETGRLEAEGFMAKINHRLRTDEAMRANLQASIKGYVDARDRIHPLGKSGHPGGGAVNRAGHVRVKCLHAHLAHHLITGDNPVGVAVLEELKWTDPSMPCV
jgi:hypothetical protein